MSRVLRMTTAACAALILVACSSDGSVSVTTIAEAVKWADYEPGLQANIDAMAVAKDCPNMQLKFNAIGGTNLAMRNKYGHGNEAVLTYIDAKERQAGCFASTVDATVTT